MSFFNSGLVRSGDSLLANVTVQVKGATAAVQTDEAGRYTFSAPATATIVFSSVDFSTREIAVNNRTSIDVTLIRLVLQVL